MDAAVFEINISRNRITGVAPCAMYGPIPRVPSDVFFPDNHVQGVLNWTNFVFNLSKHFEDIHEEMMKHEQLCIPVSTEIKIPRGSTNISRGDIVYYMSPKGVVNLSKKLTLRWTGPYRVTGTPTESISVFDPIGSWAVNKRELHVLTSRLKKVDTNYSRPVNEKVDLYQLNYEDNEGNVVQTPMDKESYTPDVQLDKHTEVLMNEKDYIPRGLQGLLIPWRPLGIYPPDHFLKVLLIIHQLYNLI